MPETSSQQPDQDPVVTSSLSVPLLISALLLVLVLFWSLYDELYGQRLWKSYQDRFVKNYTSLIQKQLPAQAEQEKQIRQSPEFQKLEQAAAAAEDAVRPQIAEIDREISQVLTPQIAVLNKHFAEARGEVQALQYQMETAASQRSKESYRKDIAAAENRKREAELPTGNGVVKKITFNNYGEMDAELTRLKARKAELETKRIELLKPAEEARRKRDAYMKDHLVGLTEAQMQGLLRKMQTFVMDIKQIHVADVDLVDRCESCHLATREPLKITKAEMGGEPAFTSHPAPELLEIHDPERFGCTPCHNGNGRATTSVEKAHGKYKHWLWPLYDRANMEAGCQECHIRDMVLTYADTLNQAKALVDHRGCVGCHRYEGYDPEPEQLQIVQQTISQKEALKHQMLLDAQRTISDGDRAPDNKTAQQLYAKADNLRVMSSGIDNEIGELDRQAKNLMRERKKVGPSLKEVRVKLNRDWIPVWLEDPQDFRPGSRMPRFRLDDDQRKAIAAFIWQAGVPGQLPSRPKGDSNTGKELFETRGCMGCHSVGEGDNSVGGTFAANLTRVGEKANYEYLVRWVHDPRERTRPYCPLEKRDIGPEDYQKAGLPFVFDPDHSTCPNDGHEMQVQQMTVMPSLRLTNEEAQDIASYLITLRKKVPNSYPAAPYMDDPALKAKGLAWVKHYGCAGCHEIAGLEEEGRIGTELTKEGSKPIERLDFALLTHKAEREGWYNNKGFFEHKLENPAVYDEGRERPPLERLRMPDFDLKPDEITALTTLLLGSVDSALPPRYFHQPEGQGRDIQEGWRIVMKYNCMGCHVLRLGQRSVIMDLPRYQDPDWKEQIPPQLIGEGARVDPVWLSKFLANPALSETDTNRNGVRPYLNIRMPTFFLSDHEVAKLVRFFEALSSEQGPYIPPKLEPLTEQERSLARALFTSPGAPCLQCHATGDPRHDEKATAPSFVLSRLRLRPDWTRRWMLDPAMMSPGTAMPSGLFKPEANRMVFAGPTPPGFEAYKKDHAQLLVRYMFEFTPEEQRRLAGSAPMPASASRSVPNPTRAALQ
ncbi:MAG: c-type cytochrome [Acidobacteria bacterium]|nr:c-type cytochrome [Acidobacteriota bacterium]